MIRELNYGGRPVRILQEEDEVYICQSDLAKALGIADGRLTKVPYPGKMAMLETWTTGGIQPHKMIRIDNVVTCLNKIKTTESSSMKKWLAEETA
jgi:prophage antirepressor-like protein